MDSRFLYVVRQLGAGGSERQLYLLLRTMDRKRYRPGVVVWNFSEDDIYVPRIRKLGVPLYSLLPAASSLGKLFAFRRLVMHTKPQVVHSYSFCTNVVAWWGAVGTNAITIGAVRSDFRWAKNVNGYLLGKLSARWPRTQIFNSFEAAKEARDLRGLFAPEGCFVVHNGLDLEEFRFVPAPLDDTIQILGVGSLSPVKRWDRLLMVALELKRKGFRFFIRIAGNGPLRSQLLDQARHLDIMDRLELLGHRDDIPDLLSSATFLVHTSDSEGSPNVVMEAMACGRAVIATDVGDIPDIVDDCTTGFIVPREDQMKLTQRVATLIADRNLCRHMGESGRVKAEREFGLSRLIPETLAVYQAAGWMEA